MSRIFIGNLPYDVRERDIEDFFRRQGKIRDIILKDGFAFVEFRDSRDANDAVNYLNGAKLMGDRVNVEYCNRDKRGGRGAFRGGRGGHNSRFGPPTQTSHRVLVQNLSTRISWQELKDYFRGKGCEVTYADAHRQRKNEAIMCFISSRDVNKALKYDGKEMNGRKIKLVDDSRGKSKSRSRSRSRSFSAKRSRSSSESMSESRSTSRSNSAESEKKEKSASSAKSKSSTEK